MHLHLPRPTSRLFPLAAVLVVGLIAGGGTVWTLNWHRSTPASTSRSSTPAVAAAANDQIPTYLGVIEGDGGHFQATDTPSVYSLQLTGVDTQSLWFTDRPLHQAGTDTTQSVIGHFFKPGSAPPNAAVRVANASAGKDTVVVALASPQYDATTHVLNLQATVLDTATSGLQRLAPHPSKSLDETFGHATVFLDYDSQSCAVQLLEPPVGTGYDMNGAYMPVLFENLATSSAYGGGVSGQIIAGASVYVYQGYPAQTYVNNTEVAISQGGTWDYGCGGGASVDVYANAANTNGQPPTSVQGQYLGTIQLSWGNPETGADSFTISCSNNLQCDQVNAASGNNPTWQYNIYPPAP